MNMAERAREMTNPVDPMSQAAWRALEARVRARRGDTRRGLELMADAVDWIHRTDQTNEQADVHETYAEVAELAGDVGLAERELQTAYELFMAKENIARARRVRAQLKSGR